VALGCERCVNYPPKRWVGSPPWDHFVRSIICSAMHYWAAPRREGLTSWINSIIYNKKYSIVLSNYIYEVVNGCNTRKIFVSNIRPSRVLIGCKPISKVVDTRSIIGCAAQLEPTLLRKCGTVALVALTCGTRGTNMWHLRHYHM